LPIKLVFILRKKIIVSVISDIVTDQRVQKECNTLVEMGYDVCLAGRNSSREFLLDKLPFRIIRFRNPFKRGVLMYFVFNVQLFFFLLFRNTDVLWANDLDTMLPNFLVSRLKNKKLVYDSHEYFTASVNKKSSRKIWARMEKYIFPKLKNVITVNNSIKNIYEKKYKVPVTVVRNVPYNYVISEASQKVILPPDKKILLIQGMGINENRGAEEAILTMQYLPDDYILYFIGSGTIWGRLKQLVHELKLSEKVIFIEPLPYLEMMEYTRQSFLGLIFEKIDASEEHLFALPNKFFDYVHAGIPVLSSEAVEIKLLIDQYHVGDTIGNFDPSEIAKKILEISKNKNVYDLWKQNTAEASEDLNWENEEKSLINFMQNVS
jgi:glycosyltransferase involved in cell wall biosynthesis